MGRKNRRRYHNGRQHATLANVKTGVKKPKVATQIAPKAVARTRQDIKSWNRALQLTQLEDNPKWYLLQQLYDEISLDALLTSQYKNRQLKALSEKVVLKKPNGEIDEEQTKLLNNGIFTLEINRHILDSKYRGHSLIELSIDEDDKIQVELIPRANVNPRDGVVYPDYTEDKKIDYRNTSEYGTWLLEFGEALDKGLLNNAVPHTQDPTAVKRAEAMMRDMGAAAWFIIDESEKFEWAASATQSGDVYNKLITLCNNEISLLISGAVIGQDTKNGSRSKDESSQEMLQVLIDSDLRLVEQYWNETIIPALVRIGILKGELTYEYEQTEDLDQLWTITKEILPYKNIDDDWIKEKFGVEVTGDRQNANPPGEQKLDFGFFG